MSTPDYASKRFYAAAFKKGAAWGTAVAVGALNGILMKGDSGLALKQKYDQYPAIDQIMPMDGSLGLIDAIDFAPPVDLQYEMGAFGTALAMLFGTAGAPTDLTGAYKHTFQWADHVGPFGTYVEERPGAIWEVPSAMPYKLNLKVTGSKIVATLGFRGNNLTNASVVNTATQVDAVTYASRGNFVNFIQGKFLMNAQTGGALADPANKLDVSDFDLTLERSIDSEHVLGSDNIALPVEGDFPKNTLKLTLPRATPANMAYLTAFQALTAQKATLSFTGPLIGGANYYGMTIYLPRLRFADPPDAKLEGVIKAGLTFEIEEAGSAPTGMAHARPYMEVTNLLATDYLA